jgi:hypothetical protein
VNEKLVLEVQPVLGTPLRVWKRGRKFVLTTERGVALPGHEYKTLKAAREAALREVRS